MIYYLHGKEDNKGFEDYITVIESNGGYKLNINSYIGEQEINKEKEMDNILIKVISKKVYMNYEIYKIRIQNKTQNTISLDGFRKDNSIYLLDNEDQKHIALKYELIQDNVIVNRFGSMELEIKFNIKYDENNDVINVNFDDIILNYEQYKIDKEQYKDILKIEVKL